jgi:lipopolysaccharide transport system ATP-binding protein
LKPIIEVHHLSKSYTIRHEGKEQYTALRDVIAQKAKSIFSFGKKKTENSHASSKEEFWALNDISFDVEQGDRVGIIGRNGAGKSTLLKVLSRITDPTKGEIKIRGRVASLLEVGTGFHPELTGRENIFLNGAILGMSRAEIRRKFDEIVAFAEVEKFLDTPVKRYSSGMYVRLAFAVAAHLEPEILVVDEVLAVGDYQFQKKCLGKMEDVSKNEGRTVLFVSHNIAAINQLCKKAIFLSEGSIHSYGDTQHIVPMYLNQNLTEADAVTLKDYKFRIGNKKVMFEWIQLKNEKGDLQRSFRIGEDVIVAFKIRSGNMGIRNNLKLAVELKASDGLRIGNFIDSDSNFVVPDLEDEGVFNVRFRDVRFYPDTYIISLWAGCLASSEKYDHVEDCISFEITDGGSLTSRSLPRSAGLLFLTPEWVAK